MELNITSFNVRTKMAEENPQNEWDNRKDMVMNYINEMSSSIVCMQEIKISQSEDLQAGITERFGFVYYARETKVEAEGLGIAYDKSVWDKLEEEMFWLSETPEKMSKGWDGSHFRICLRVLLQHKETGAKLNVFNVHLDVKGEVARYNGMALVLDRMKDKNTPSVLCGDFNCKVDTPPYLLAASVLQDCQAVAPVSDNGTTCQSWGKVADDASTAIDFCFVSKKNMQPLTFTICRDKWGENNERFYSDHYAVNTTVEMSY